MNELHLQDKFLIPFFQGQLGLSGSESEHGYGLIESWCRGVEVMVKACSEYGLPEPVLRYEDPGFWVIFSGKTLGKTLGKTPDMILAALIQDSTLSVPELASRMNKSESAVERAIRKLRETGKLKRIGPAKGGHWQVLEK